jgi:hypothetical protein
VYKLEGRIRRFNWKNGFVDFEGVAETSGTGLQLLSRLRADGKFHARSLTLNAETAVGTASGEFDLALSRSGPQWKLTAVEAAMGSERFNGEGGTQADGRLLLDLASPARTMSVRLDVAR